MQPLTRSASVSAPPSGSGFGYFAETPDQRQAVGCASPASTWQLAQARLLPAKRMAGSATSGPISA